MSATARMHLEEYGDNTFPWIQYSFVLQRHASMYEVTVGVSALGKKLVACIKYQNTHTCFATLAVSPTENFPSRRTGKFKVVLKDTYFVEKCNKAAHTN